MNYKLIAGIARALLLARWRQTLVAAIGVTFSITMFIAMLGFMTGLNKLLDGLILNRLPHVRLFNDVEPNKNQPINTAKEYKHFHNFIQSVKSAQSRSEIHNSATIIQAIKADNRVLGFVPKIKTQVFYNDGSIDFSGLIDGIDVAGESKWYHFNDYITAGRATDLNNVSNSIILGKAIAQKLLADIGDVVQVTSSKGDRMSLKVVGFFQSGILDIDKVQSYTSIATAQKLLGKTNSYITDIQINLKDITQAPAVAKEYVALFDTDAEDIQTANSQFETGSSVRTLISYVVGITLLIVAGFGIYNILNMMIYEKMDTIAILKATGFSGKDVNLVFITIALSIGLFGGLAGLFFGYLLSVGVDNIPFNMSGLPAVKTYPVNYNPVYYFIAIAFSLFTTYLAGLFPARRASKVDPVIIIRGK
ncbi:ABC transporter permease [Segetibacter koreensis]|uniref:ABC transporter permease n=1 Tax=Segetibacter koreensis TaxID=398037 RepID=UPI00037162CA|nr:FtsX-like permease family protein [Segetibacter koreensis]